jgi:two-component system, OmpR family, KDP operon response regulator KdpE
MKTDEIRILVIDDESAIRNMLRLNLENSGFKIGEADSGEAGLAQAASFHPHLIILDLGLPDMTGLEVLKRLRKWTSIPILILTVTDDEEMKVLLLDAGADDYLTKPFGIPELTARIRVGLRNRRAVEATPLFQSGDLEVDLNAASVKVSGRDVKLTTTEYELLKILVREQGKVVPQHVLLVSVWGPNGAQQSHYLRIYIGQLRKKIENDPSTPRHIVTESGVGYRLV